jgi:hypothetical protein
VRALGFVAHLLLAAFVAMAALAYLSACLLCALQRRTFKPSVSHG